MWGYTPSHIWMFPFGKYKIQIGPTIYSTKYLKHTTSRTDLGAIIEDVECFRFVSAILCWARFINVEENKSFVLTSKLI